MSRLWEALNKLDFALAAVITPYLSQPMTKLSPGMSQRADSRPVWTFLAGVGKSRSCAPGMQRLGAETKRAEPTQRSKVVLTSS